MPMKEGQVLMDFKNTPSVFGELPVLIKLGSRFDVYGRACCMLPLAGPAGAVLGSSVHSCLSGT